MIKYLTYTCLLFSGKNHQYFRNIRTRCGLTDLVQIHHIIPREFRNHPAIIDSGYNIEDGYNLVFLPTRMGVNGLNLHNDRPIHYGGHLLYNRYVGACLDEMSGLDNMSDQDATRREELCRFNRELRQNMRHCKIDWCKIH